MSTIKLFSRACLVSRDLFNVRRISNPLYQQVRGKKKYEKVLRQVLYTRRTLAGPEPERHRSEWSNWNYDAEIYAFGKRLGEEFMEETLKRAFTHSSYITTEGKRLVNLGLSSDTALLALESNDYLADAGRELSSQYVKAFLRYSYPYLPEEGIQSGHDFLMSEEKQTFIATQIGITDLILCADFPPLTSTLCQTLHAVIGGLAHDQGDDRARRFVQDFILPQLIGQDISEMWNILNPMGLLCDILSTRGRGAPEPRLIGQNGPETIMSVFYVGIYSDKQLIGKSPGETLLIAEEMAARDALKRMFRTTDSRAELPWTIAVDDIKPYLEKENISITELQSS